MFEILFAFYYNNFRIRQVLRIQNSIKKKIFFLFYLLLIIFFLINCINVEVLYI